MIKHRGLFSIICFSMSLSMAACAGPQKTAQIPLRDITLSPSPAIIIKDHYTFIFETARCADTQQFLITEASFSIPDPEKALKVNLQALSPKTPISEPLLEQEVIKSLSVFFPLGSSTMDAHEAKKLTQFIKELKQNKTGPVNVTGYTCRIGSAEYNKKLALNRAKTVGDVLKKQGICVRSITGKPECCFISDTDPTQNRRVEITVTQKPEQSVTINHEGGDQEIKH